MFEFYAEEDNEFVDTILKETFEITESLTGYKPLICELITPEMEMEKNWIAYPAKAKTITETFMHGQHAITHKV